MNWWMPLGVFAVTVLVSLPMSLYWISRMAGDQKRRMAEVVAATDHLRDLSKQCEEIQDTFDKLNKALSRRMV